MSDCIFCKLASKAIPSEFLHETPYAFAIADQHPVAKTHVLIIAKKHYGNLTAAYEDVGEAEETITSMMLMARHYGDKNLPNGYRIVINTGDDAGQTVKHFHVHVLGGEKLKDL